MKAKQRGRAVEPMDLERIETALRYLRDARSYLRDAGCNNAANYVQRAVKSTEGAFNNAEAQLRRSEREAWSAPLPLQRGPVVPS